MSPALASGFFTTELPWKPLHWYLNGRTGNKTLFLTPLSPFVASSFQCLVSWSVLFYNSLINQCIRNLDVSKCEKREKLWCNLSLDWSLEYSHLTFKLKCFGDRSSWRGPVWRVHRQDEYQKGSEPPQTGHPLTTCLCGMMLCSVASQSCPVLATSPSATKCYASTLYVKNCQGAKTTTVSVFKIQGLNSACGSCILLGGAADDFSRRLWHFLIPGWMSTHSLTLAPPSVAGLRQPAEEQNQLTSYSGLTICCLCPTH